MANSVTLGVAYTDQAIVGGTVDNTTIGATTKAAGKFTTLNATGATTLDGAVALGDAAGDLIAFHGASAVAQAAIATAITTAVTAGFANSADFLTMVTTVNAIRTLLINKGLMAAS